MLKLKLMNGKAEDEASAATNGTTTYGSGTHGTKVLK